MRQVYVQDVRFVDQPNGEVQRKEWERVLSEEAFNIYQPGIAEEVVKRFFDRLAEPQLAVANSSPLPDAASNPAVEPDTPPPIEESPTRKRPRTGLGQ